MEKQPDGFEKGVRFGCGALFGLAVGFFIVLRWSELDRLGCLAVMVVAALGCGAWARYLGNDFWHAIARWFPWW